MRARCAVALVPLLVACGVTAGCSSGGSPVAGDPVAGGTNSLNCGMVVDTDGTGYFGGPLTVGRAVAMLTEVQHAEGTANIVKGTLSGTDLDTLNTLADDLLGYAGNKLSADAAAFAQAALNYDSPAGLPINTSYARPLASDIAALEDDCPFGLAPGLQHPNAGS